MEIEFSDKYQPLFEILSAWDIIDDPDFKDIYTDEEQEYWQSLKEVDTILMYGGRDSGKTFAESVWIPIAVKDYNHRVLYTRYTMNSTDNSISEALTERMSMLNCTDEFEYASNTYTHRGSQGKIFITGQKTSSLNQTAKLKSLENFSIFVTDEAEEIKAYEEWDKIRKSIRAKDVQCLNLLVFNPPTREHWLYTDFFEELDVQEGFTGIKDNVLYIHTTYLDNIDNIALHNLREYEKLKESYDYYKGLSYEEREQVAPKIKKGYRKYKHVVLGGFLDVAEGVIYEDWRVGEFNDSLPYCYGLDFGSNDPDALVKVAVDHNEMRIHLHEAHFKNNTGTAQLMQYIHEKVGTTDLIIADSAQRRLIKDLYHGMHGPDGQFYSGVNIRKVRKSKGQKLNFVARGIKTLQSYELVVTLESKNIQKALKNYCWHNSRAGVPNHDYSDLCDAFRYGAMDMIER